MKASGNKTMSSGLVKVLLWLNIFNSLLLVGAYLNTHISPNSIGYISFLGLGYPILLLSAIIFIVIWIFLKRKFILISVITLIIGWNHLRHFFVITIFQPAIENPIKILSYNVHIFDLYNLEGREQNKQEIFDFLKEEDADILCFQEFYHQEAPATFVTKDEMIPMLNTPYYQERYTHEMTGEKYFGVATFSKYPIINRGEISFENDNNNFCIYSDIVKEEDTIRVFNAHLGSIRLQNDDYEFFGDEEGPQKYIKDKTGQRILGRLKTAFEKRAVQAEKVAVFVENSPYPVILCGDLNDTPVSYCYRQFNRLLYDSFVECGNGVGQTYIGKVPSNRIDYIFHSEEFTTANFTTHQVNLSDHKPVSVEIGLE